MYPRTNCFNGYPGKEKTRWTRTERHNSTGSRWTRWFGPNGDGSAGGVYYSYNTPVKIFLAAKKMVVFTSESYSVTTAKHMGQDPFDQHGEYVGAPEYVLRELGGYLDDLGENPDTPYPQSFVDTLEKHRRKEALRTLTVGEWVLRVSAHGQTMRASTCGQVTNRRTGERMWWKRGGVTKAIQQPEIEAMYVDGREGEAIFPREVERSLTAFLRGLVNGGQSHA